MRLTGKNHHGSTVLIVLLILSIVAAAGLGAVSFTMYTSNQDLKRLSEKVPGLENDVNSRDSKIDDLKEEIESRKNDTRMAIGDKDEYARDLTDVKRERDRYRTDASKLRGDLDSMTRDLSTRNSELGAKRIELRDADARLRQIQNENDGLKTDLKDERSKLAAALTASDRKLSDLTTDIRNRDKTLDRLKMKLDKQDADFAAFKEEINSKGSEAEKTLMDLKDRLRSAERDLYNAGREKRSLMDDYKDLKKGIASLKTENKTLKDEIADLKHSAATTPVKGPGDDKELARLKRKIEEKDEKINALNLDNRSKDIAIAGLNRDVKEKTSDIIEFKKDVKDKEKEIRSLTDRLLAGGGPKDEEFLDLKGKIREIKWNLKMKNQEFNKMQREKDDEITEKTKEVKDLRASAAVSGQTTTEKDKTILDQNKEIEKLKKDLTHYKALPKARIIPEEDMKEIPEQIRLSALFQFSHARASVTATTNAGVGNKLDLFGELGMKPDGLNIDLEFSALGRFGFLFDGSMRTFSGKGTMPRDQLYDNIILESGHRVDSSFTYQQAAFGFFIGLGYLKKTDVDRADLTLLLGGRFIHIDGDVEDLDDGDKAGNSIDAAFPMIGLRTSYIMKEGFWITAQLLASMLQYDRVTLDLYLEPKLLFCIPLSDTVDLLIGYKYTDLHIEKKDKDPTIQRIERLDYRADGPCIGIVGRF